MSLLYEAIEYFEEEAHEYKVEGVSIPSVTTVLKEMGFMKNLNFYTPSGASRGTYIHALTEQYDDGTLDWSETMVFDEDGHMIADYTPFLEAYAEAKDELSMDVLLREEKMYNSSLWIAGTLDNVCRINGEEIPYIIDLKSGQEEAWHFLQLLLYGTMIKYRYGNMDIPLKMGTLYLKKSGKYKFVEKSLDKAFQEGAIGAVKAYHIRRTMI